MFNFKIGFSSAEVDYGRGVKSLETKKYQEALVAFNAALLIEPNHSASLAGKFAALVGIAKVAQAEKDWELAESYLKDAHALNPNEEEVNVALASVRRQHYLTRISKTKFSMPAVSAAKPISLR
jgi:tetratricopeptide (TPR) repeat protein